MTSEKEAKFARLAESVMNPEKLVREILLGTATADQVRALIEVYPTVAVDLYVQHKAFDDMVTDAQRGWLRSQVALRRLRGETP